MNKHRKILTDAILCILLWSLLLGFMLTLLLSKDEVFSEKENRALKSKPTFTVEKAINGRYFSEITSFCTDQFPFRKRFTALSSKIDILLLRNEANGIIVMDDRTLVPRCDYENLEILCSNLDSISLFINKYNSINTPAYIAVAPRAIDVKKNQLPFYFSQKYGKNEYEELYKRVEATHLIDTLPSIIKAGDNNTKTWYNTDHHWTTDGAYIAYLDIAKKLGIDAYPIDYFNIEKVNTNFLGTSFQKSGLSSFHNEDTIVLFRYKNDNKITVWETQNQIKLYDFSALKTTDKYRVFLGGNTDIIRIRNQENKPKLLLIKDSFANSVIPFLALHFDIDAIDLRYYKSSLSKYISNNKFDCILILYGIETLANEVSCANIKK